MNLSRRNPSLKGDSPDANCLRCFPGGIGLLTHVHTCIVFLLTCQAKSARIFFASTQSLANKKPIRKYRAPVEYWIFDRGVLLHANGRPLILKGQKTAERFISEMGMDGDWKIEERPAIVRETRGRKSKVDDGTSRALLAWAMMEVQKRPERYEDQRAFMKRFHGAPTGNPKEKRKAVRAFIKKIRRLHRMAQINPSIDKLLSS
jgi:hypothetical protein